MLKGLMEKDEEHKNKLKDGIEKAKE